MDEVLSFFYVTIGQDNLYRDGKEGMMGILELIITENVASVETMYSVEVNIVLKVFDDGAALAIGDVLRRAISNVSGNGM